MKQLQNSENINTSMLAQSFSQQQKQKSYST